VATSAFQRLLRVLELEERQGWRNRAVIGGLQAMAARWQKDASLEEADPQIVSTVIVLMERYQAGTVEARLVCAESIRRALAGETVVIHDEVVITEEEDGSLLVERAERVESIQEREDAPHEELAKAPASKGRKQTRGDKGPQAPATQESQPAYDESELIAVPPPEATHVARERIRRQQAVSRRSPDDLLAPVTVLSGVGSSTAEILARLGIVRVVDLIWHLPSRHDDYSQQRTIAQMPRRTGDGDCQFVGSARTPHQYETPDDPGRSFRQHGDPSRQLVEQVCPQPAEARNNHAL